MARAARANTRFDLLVLIICAALSLVMLVLPTPVREPIAGALRRTVLAPFMMLQERAELSRRTFLQHESVVQTRDSIALRAVTATALQSENDRLRAMLGLGKRLQWGFVAAEALHGDGRDPFGMIVSAGTNAGIQRLNPIVAPEGLVGFIDNADPTMSHAMLWTNPEFRVSAMSQDGNAFGIVQAHVVDGPGRYMMEMRGVPFRTSVKNGALIVSSGLGGVYPRGIPIGYVVGETKTNETWARTYLIRPAVFPGDVYSVMILRPDRASEGVDNVWSVGAGLDTAVHKIVAAGDSMARAAALAEAKARQAAQDSLATDTSAAARAARQAAGTVVPGDTARQHLIPRRPPAVRRDSAAPRDTTIIPNTL